MWAPSCSSKGVCRGFQRLRDERSSWYFFQCLCAWRRSVYDICCAISTWITCSLCRSARRCEGRSCKTDSCAFLRGYIIRFTSTYSCCWEAFQRILQYSHRGGSCRRKKSKWNRIEAPQTKEEKKGSLQCPLLLFDSGPVLKQRPVTFIFVREAVIIPVLICFTVTAELMYGLGRPGVRERPEPVLESRSEFGSCASCSLSVSKMGILSLTGTSLKPHAGYSCW